MQCLADQPGGAVWEHEAKGMPKRSGRVHFGGILQCVQVPVLPCFDWDKDRPLRETVEAYNAT